MPVQLQQPDDRHAVWGGHAAAVENPPDLRAVIPVHHPVRRGHTDILRLTLIYPGTDLGDCLGQIDRIDSNAEDILAVCAGSRHKSILR